MLKLIFGFVVLLILIIGLTVWMGQKNSNEPAVVPETYVPFPEAPVTPLEVPKNFDDLVTTPPTNLFTKVQDQMHLDTYTVISCAASQNQEKAILLTAKYVENESGNNFNAALTAVSDWESSMLVDIGKVIFPSINDNERTQLVVFSNVPNTEYRIAPITVGGKKTSLHYGWQDNYVVFASTKECLGEILRTVQDGA